MNAIPKIYISSNGKYKITKTNDIFKQITLEALELLSLGVYIDFNLTKINDNSTEITIEIRRKIGSFDNSVEIQNASNHFDILVQELSNIIILSDNEFNIKYAENIKNINEIEEDNAKPWFAKKYVANTWLILGICTLPFILGIFILPIGIYAKYKNAKYKK